MQTIPRMRPIFDTCRPRPEVLAGDLTEDTFAARLRDVVEGKADAAYQDPAVFFRNTFPTEGLRTVTREVLGRLSGQEPANSPFVRLETSFGGGKTHNLIALYHLANGGGRAALDAGNARHGVNGNGIVPGPEWLPEDRWAVTGVVGSDLDPAEGIDHGGVRTRTRWGELAWQLGERASTSGGVAAYKHVRRSDEALTAPGTQALERVVGDEPTLIMLDEIARYLRVAKAVATANEQSDLAEQTVAFLMTLIELAASRDNISLVLTLADSKDAFGDETEMLIEELDEARKVSARHERVITPAAESEIAPIVRHRLFESFDEAAAKKTADAYAACYRELSERGAEIPERALRANFRDEMVENYPFHPELFTVLTRKTATIPHFQKTRGALRLLARMLRRLWDESPPDAWTIAPFHIDLGDEGILNDLTSRLDRPAFRTVAEADISSGRSGAPAHAEKLDERWLSEDKPPYGRRLATSIFVHSLTRGIAAGVELPDLLVATVQPGDDPQLLRKTLARAQGEERGVTGEAFWFLHWDGRQYLFKTEPSLEKVVQDELALVGLVAAKDEIDRRIKQVWRRGTFDPLYFPAEAADLPDDSTAPKLAVPHFEACSVDVNTGARPEPPDLVRKLFGYAGTTESPRTFKNNIVFLVADRAASERMVDLARRYMAIRRIVGDRGRMTQFGREHQKRLRSMGEASELEVRVGITRAYRHLFYPSADAPRRSDGLAYQALAAPEQGRVSRDQTSALVSTLRGLEKVLTGDDPPLSAQYVRAKAWISGREEMSTDDLRREFGKRLGLKIILDPNQLKRTIKDGCRHGVWVYHDGTDARPYGKDSRAPLVEISEDAMLYTLGAAGRLFPEPDEPPSQECPLCEDVECSCDEPDPPITTTRLVSTHNAAPGRVFQRIKDEFHDAKRQLIGKLVVTCEGLSDMRSLALAVPQLPKGQYAVMHGMTAEFGVKGEDGSLQVEFNGDWARYKRLRSVLETQAEEAAKTKISLVLTATYANGLDTESADYQTMRDVLVQLDLGRIEVSATELKETDGAEPTPPAG